MFCGFICVHVRLFTLNLGECWLQNAHSHNGRIFRSPVFLYWLRRKYIQSFSWRFRHWTVSKLKKLPVFDCLKLILSHSTIFHLYGHAYLLSMSRSQDLFRFRTNGTKRAPWRKEMPNYINERETQNFATPLEKLRMQLCLCSSNTRGSMTKQRKQREKKTKR